MLAKVTKRCLVTQCHDVYYYLPNIVCIILTHLCKEEYLATRSNLRQAMEGREFHFVKSVSVVMPTAYVAHDLSLAASAAYH